MVSPDSYGSVLLLIVITYVLSVTLTQPWSRSVVLLVQIGTVWLALHASRARRGVRVLASMVLVVAGGVAIGSLVWSTGSIATQIVFSTSALLYFIAPLSILRAIVMQRTVSRETVLGAIDAYLLIGMFFAYVYQALGAIGSEPLFEGGSTRRSPSRCSSASRPSPPPVMATSCRPPTPARPSPSWKC